MVFSGSQWFLGSYKHKMCDRNNATAGQSTHSDLCTAICRQLSQRPYWLDYIVGFMIPILTRKKYFVLSHPARLCLRYARVHAN